MNNEIVLDAEQILRTDTVEGTRLEVKASWDAHTTGPQILNTIAAFANDYQNQNGGYVVLGVAEENGKPILPPVGLDEESIDDAQMWIQGHCRHLSPEYFPHFEIGIIEGKKVLVVWAPGSDLRPHSAPGTAKGERIYWIRLGSATVKAQGTQLTELIQMTARVPFDNRRNLQADVKDIRETKVREFLRDVGSALAEETDVRTLYRKLNIAVPVNHHDAPRNVGLLFFSDNPEKWFPGARIEVVQFANGRAGDVMEERTFTGGIHEQLRGALRYLETISGTAIEKSGTSVRVKNVVSYPLPALREALVNAVYHRSYDGVVEPVKVYLHPNRIEIISYPGPVPGISAESLHPPFNVPPVPARNSRIGEFLKDIHLAEKRGTGLPKIGASMRENGSGDPVFDFDPDRSYFRVTLPAHPEYVAVATIRDVAHLKTIGHEKEALERLREAWEGMNASPALTEALLREVIGRGQMAEADRVWNAFKKVASPAHAARVANGYINALANAGLEEKARNVLNERKTFAGGMDAVDMAVLARRLHTPRQAHVLFEQAGDIVVQDARALHEFAQTKLDLARDAYRGRRYRENKRLLREALHLLERVVGMETDDIRRAWAYRDMARAQTWLRLPLAEREESLRRACELLPSEADRFREEFAKKGNQP